MGVYGLKSFMYRIVPNGYIRVNIEEAVEAERQRTKRKPLLVIDINSLARRMGINTKDMICGGRSAVTIKQIDSFLTKLQSFDVDLVFFTSGIKKGLNFGGFKSLAKRVRSKMINVIDQIDSGKSFDELTDPKYDNTSMEVPYTNTFKYTLVLICRKYGKIVITVHCDKVKLMVTYALNYNALAIIANTTDLLIFNGSWRYWCSEDLQINNRSPHQLSITTLDKNKQKDTIINFIHIMEFNRNALRRQIFIKNDQLPLFATCCGNNDVKYDNIKEFHNSLGTFKWKFTNIVKYIRQYKYPNNLSAEELQRITADLYGKYTEKKMNLIKKSIEYYNDDNFKELNHAEYDQYVERWLYDVNICCIVYAGNFKIRNMYFDYSQTDYISYPDVVLPILKRQMGVLLKHKNDSELRRCVLIKGAIHKSGAEKLEVQPIYPKIEDLSNDELYQITYKTHSDKEDKRWEILCWMISDSLHQHSKKLKTLPKQYLCSCLTLYYLVEFKVITIWEADIILLTIDEQYKNGIPVDIDYPKKLEKRAYILSSLFAKLYMPILRCINIAGLRDYMELQAFDGVYYHNLMRELSDISEEDQMAAVEDIKNYRIYCT